MRNLIFAISLILTINVCAQNRFENAKVFVRVYNLQGKKIGKGKIITISPTSIQINSKLSPQLNGNRELVEIPVDSIGTIKTKHSEGNNILVGAAIGAVTGAIIGAVTTSPESADDLFFPISKEEAAVAGVVLGGIAGGGFGAISILFKNSEFYEINGDMIKWVAFTEIMTNKLPN